MAVKTFAGSFVWNTAYTIAQDTPDGPIDQPKDQAVLAGTLEEALEVVRQIEMPAEVKFMAVQLAFDGEKLVQGL